MCMEELPPDPVGGDIGAELWQGTGATGEGGPAYPDHTFRRALQLRRRSGSPWLLDCSDKEAERIEESLPTFDLQ